MIAISNSEALAVAGAVDSGVVAGEVAESWASSAFGENFGESFGATVNAVFPVIGSFSEVMVGSAFGLTHCVLAVGLMRRDTRSSVQSKPNGFRFPGVISRGMRIRRS